MKNITKNKIVATFFFLSGTFILNVSQTTIATNAIGASLLIASAYGVVAITKNAKYFA